MRISNTCEAAPAEARPAEAGPARTTGDAKQPKILIVTAFRWSSTGRLALELSEAGFAVEALCPVRYLEQLPFVEAIYRYNALAPIASLRAAIATSRPTLLVPYDDHVAAQLHELYRLTVPDEPAGLWLRSLIARSLGSPEHFPILYSRYHVCSLARELEIPCPRTELVTDMTSLGAELNSLEAPAVLKSDGSWGGRGVVVVRNNAEAVRAFRKLAGPPSALRALKRLMIDRDPTLVLPCLRRRPNAVSIQEYVHGRPANAAVACWEGKVLAAVFVEVLCSEHATGPSTVVRVVSHAGMSDAVERMVERLNLSGLCGFDFVLSEEDGTAQFIELNPRATPTCHLIAEDGKNLLAALNSALRGAVSPNCRQAPRFGPIALFPQEIARDPDSPFLQSAYHDVPWQSAELVNLGRPFWQRRARSLAKGVRRSVAKPVCDPGDV